MASPNIPASSGASDVHPIIPPNRALPFVDQGGRLTPYAFQFLQQLYTAIVNAAPHLEFTPNNPTPTVSLTPVMMGIAGSFTSLRSGHIWITIAGSISNDTALDGALVQARFGTGTAPANGDVLAGTLVGNVVENTQPLAAGQIVPFSVQGVAHPNIGDTIWIDLALNAITGGTAKVIDLSITAIEL